MFVVEVVLFFLLELPLAAFLALVIYIDVISSNHILIPLELIIFGAVVFTVIFLFRAVTISYDKVSCIGPFSSKYSAYIKKDRELRITRLSRSRLKIEIFGYNNDGEESYAWLKSDVPTMINLFRTKTNGTIKSIKKILNYFEVDAEMIEKAVSVEEFSAELDKITLSTSIDLENKVYSIFFKETL